MELALSMSCNKKYSVRGFDVVFFLHIWPFRRCIEPSIGMCFRQTDTTVRTCYNPRIYRDVMATLWRSERAIASSNNAMIRLLRSWFLTFTVCSLDTPCLFFWSEIGRQLRFGFITLVCTMVVYILYKLQSATCKLQPATCNENRRFRKMLFKWEQRYFVTPCCARKKI